MTKIMKRISFIIAALAAIVFASCTKQEVEDITSYYKAYLSNTSEINLGEGQTVSVDFYAKTTDAGVDGPVSVSFMADPSLVGTYNAEHGTDYLALPESCYTIQTEAKIRAMYRMSSEAKATISFGNDLAPMTNYVLPITLTSVSGHDKAFLAEDNAPVFIVVKIGKIGGGAGTLESPYVIYDAEDLKDIAKKTKSSDFNSRDAYLAIPFTYFKLANDIDLGGEAWTPIDLGMDKETGKKIDLDGNGKTIKGLNVKGGEQVGLIKGLVGDVHDLNIEGTVETTAKKAGLLCGQASSGDNIFTNIYRCSAKGTIKCGTSSDSKAEASLGGLVGQQCYGYIHECEADVTIELGGENYGHYVGGIVGSFGKKGLEIRNCIAKGNYFATSGSNAYMFGGIVGCTQNVDNVIENCISLAKINCFEMAGGIIGELNKNKDSGISDNTSVVKGCIAWNEAIDISAEEITFGKGGIVGFGGAVGISNCWMKPELGFADHSDVESGAASAPGIRNGKNASGTASQAAKQAGWDETIWDLSGDVPALKTFKK